LVKHQGFDGCELCREVDHRWSVVTGFDAPCVPGGPFSRLVRSTPVVDVVSGIGAIVPGYVLVVTKRHVCSTGELSAGERRHAFATAWAVAKEIREMFGKAAVLVEHGSSGDAIPGGRACIDHAHLHLFPVEEGVAPTAFAAPRSELVESLDVLGQAASARRNYYYCAGEATQGFLSLTPSVASQQARRVWADLVGRRDQWDWAAFPHFDNCRLTVRGLRRECRNGTGGQSHSGE
jgi:diadenosine tetraphosphate (Ap4A) HIT family hydrolase